MSGIPIDGAVLEFIQELLITLGIGFLLGLEREFSKGQEKSPGKTFAGVRTFPLVTLLGYLGSFGSTILSEWLFIVVLAGTTIMIGISYYITAMAGDRGGTTEFALIISFLLGGLVAKDYYQLSVILAIVVTGMLAFKVGIHRIISNLDKEEVYSILLFVIITALVLPLLPNEDFGPFGVLNPYKIWLIVSIFVTLNFLAYFLNKFIDKRRSIIITGVLGGFVSSTATTWYFTRLSKKNHESGSLEAAAIIMASSIMFPRMMIWLLLLNMGLLRALFIPLVLLGVIGLITGILISRGVHYESNEDIKYVHNPINLREALIFAVIYVAILLMVGYANRFYGDGGVYLASLISGLTDIDAITISLSDFGSASHVQRTAAAALMIAAMSNTLVKYILCMFLGNGRLKKKVSYAFIPFLVIGLICTVYYLIA